MSLYSEIGKQFNIYVGSILFLIGIFGNLINSCIFSKSIPKNSSTFLLLVSSYVNLISLIGGLLTRILAVGFNLDWTIRNIIWCKMRLYISQVSSFVSLSCICYALLDQYFISCQQEKWRRLCKLSITRFLTCLIILFWIFYTLPIPILIQLIPKSNGTYSCSIVNDDYRLYLSYFGTYFVNGIFPIIFCTIIGILTYRNVSLLICNRHRQRVQRHLTSMILLQSIFLIIGSTPFGLFYMYVAITSNNIKSSDRLGLENLIATIISLFSYCSPVFSFFLYYFSSETFRNQFKQLFNICQRQTLVLPLS